MRKTKPPSELQIQNLRDTIRQLETPIELEALAIQIETLFRQPRETISEAQLFGLLNRFLFIMGR